MLEVSIELAAEPAVPRTARRFVDEALTDWVVDRMDQLSASNGSPRIRQRRLRFRGVAVTRADQEAMAFREDPVFEVERCCGFEGRPCADVLIRNRCVGAGGLCGHDC